jgi:hypothetical protein
MSKPTCIFSGPVSTRSGYGEWAADLVKSLIRYNKFDIKIAPTRWGACTRKHFAEDMDPMFRDLIMTQPLTQQPEVFVQCTIPNEFQAPAKYNIGITAGIESSVPRGDWLDGINRMNMTFVLSKHVFDVFSKASFTKTHPDGKQELLKVVKPMEVLNWSADTSIYHKTDITEPEVEESMSKIPESFAFLHVGQWTSGGLYNDRKDIGNLIRVFLETFKGVKDNKPCLIVKTSGAAICNMDKYDMIARIKEIERQVSGGNAQADLPKVYLLYGELSDKEMNALYNHKKVKAHVSFTHGEGGGHPILLATLSGKPVITSGWSGHLDYLNPEYTKFFKGEVKPISPDAVNEWLIKESSWFYVDYMAAGDRMKSLFYHYGAFLKDAEKLRQENMVKFSEAAMDKVFHSLLDAYVPQFSTAQKIILPKLLKKAPKPIATVSEAIDAVTVPAATPA